MELPEKYKENVNVSSEGASSGVTRIMFNRHKYQIWYKGYMYPVKTNSLILQVYITLYINT
jgi:hypothetical protein